MASIRSKILAALAALFFVAPALAQPAGSPGGGGSVIRDFSGAVQAIIGAYPGMVPGSTVTRPANNAQYSVNSTVCGATSVTVCQPGTISIASVYGGSNVGNGRMMSTRVTLLKSGSTATGNFVLWFFSAAPVVTTPNQFDGTSYTGPRSADMPNYLGNASCTGGTATSDTTPGVWYECALSNPNIGGALVMQALLGTRVIDYLISSATPQYIPATSETFTPFMGGFY